MDNDKWKEDGFNLYLEGLQAKFSQNRNLWSMLKTTEPKGLIEASIDRLWGTGISMKDSHVLDEKYWTSKGWLSNMLNII